MACLRPLARHSGSRSLSVHEAGPIHTAGRRIQVERRHGIAGTVSPANGITPAPDSGPGRPVDNISALSPHTADCAHTNGPVAPAGYPTDHTVDF
jgi:hypothetical protein